MKGLYEWISTIEGLAYDITKSLLVDVGSLKFSLSISVAALISVSMLIHQEVILKHAPQHQQLVAQLIEANKVWDTLLVSFFGKKSINNIEQFGIYLYKR